MQHWSLVMFSSLKSGIKDGTCYTILDRQKQYLKEIVIFLTNLKLRTLNNIVAFHLSLNFAQSLFKRSWILSSRFSQYTNQNRSLSREFYQTNRWNHLNFFLTIILHFYINSLGSCNLMKMMCSDSCYSTMQNWLSSHVLTWNGNTTHGLLKLLCGQPNLFPTLSAALDKF